MFCACKGGSILTESDYQIDFPSPRSQFFEKAVMNSGCNVFFRPFSKVGSHFSPSYILVLRSNNCFCLIPVRH